MLTDGAAVEQVTAGPTGALSMLSPGTIWIQMSTVGVESCDRLADLAARHGRRIRRCPGVHSSSRAAEEGTGHPRLR